MDGEYTGRLKKRAEANDTDAMRNLGVCYRDGIHGLPRDPEKAMEIWLRAGKLGCPAAYVNIGCVFQEGDGVEKDMKKATKYWELAAMGGDAFARHNLGLIEENEQGSTNRAVKHWMIAAGAGFDESLKSIRKCFMAGLATKDDSERALRAHKEAKDEMKSDQREAFAAFRRKHEQ